MAESWYPSYIGSGWKSSGFYHTFGVGGRVLVSTIHWEWVAESWYPSYIGSGWKCSGFHHTLEWLVKV